MAKLPIPPTATEEEVRALLERYRCPVPFHEVEGTIEGSIDKLKVRAPTGSIIFIPANALHEFCATADRDVVFFTAKDNAHSIHGIKA